MPGVSRKLSRVEKLSDFYMWAMIYKTCFERERALMWARFYLDGQLDRRHVRAFESWRVNNGITKEGRKRKGRTLRAGIHAPAVGSIQSRMAGEVEARGEDWAGWNSVFEGSREAGAPETEGSTIATTAEGKTVGD